jgi:hypothetical protein
MVSYQQINPKIKSIDAATTDICASPFPLAAFRVSKTAIKPRIVFTDMLPCWVILSEGKTHESSVAKGIEFNPGDWMVLDRTYLDYPWLCGLHQRGVWFVTRFKSNSCCEVSENRRITIPDRVLTDQVIQLTSSHGDASYTEAKRRVRHRDPKTGKEYVFLTNRLDLPALEVAELYHRHWQIKLLCKWIKQNLKIKAFYGTSKNGGLLQVWTALIAYLLLVWLKLKSRVGWGLLKLSRLAQTMLQERRNLWGILSSRLAGC